MESRCQRLKKKEINQSVSQSRVFNSGKRWVDFHGTYQVSWPRMVFNLELGKNPGQDKFEFDHRFAVRPQTSLLSYESESLL